MKVYPDPGTAELLPVNVEDTALLIAKSAANTKKDLGALADIFIPVLTPALDKQSPLEYLFLDEKRVWHREAHQERRLIPLNEEQLKIYSNGRLYALARTGFPPGQDGTRTFALYFKR